MSTLRRRQAGEGGISAYNTKAGQRFLIKYTVRDEVGTPHTVLRRGFPTRKAAARALGEVNAEIRRGVHVLPSKISVAEYFGEWLDGLRLAPSTLASYRKNVRLHVVPYLGSLQLSQLTGTRLTGHYRHLEADGRADGAGGLSARTVRYVHTIVHAALKAAVRDGRLAINPADRAVPPSARQARSPEMHTWTADELRRFLDWNASDGDDLHVAWRLAAMTGARRGELLALRWSDLDLDGCTARVQRSATLVKSKGAGERIVMGPTKAGKPRVVDLDERTVAVLRAHRAARAELSLDLARADALVFGGLDSTVRHPERFSRSSHAR